MKETAGMSIKTIVKRKGRTAEGGGAERMWQFVCFVHPEAAGVVRRVSQVELQLHTMGNGR